ncbi:MAG TPA: hypothetical protein VNW06_12695, partial [Cytophagaceae bacterium]|nr:hypothetical protein [Cytophagaceae bacterium]
MNTHVDKIQENKSKSVANEVSQRKLVQNNFQFVDNRPEAIAQRKLQEIANKTVPLYQTIQKKSNNLDSNSFNVTQLNTWNEWEEPLTKVDAGTASLATFGMAVIKMLSEAYKLRIGGSLAAKMYGAPRQPVDIDFEVSGEAKKATEAKEHFMKLAQRPKFTWIHGRNVFFITDYAPQGGVVAIDFKCVKADKEPNPYDDEDEDLI